jgi:hypothetical protein
MDILGSLIFGFFEGNSVNPTWLRASRDGRLDLMIELERPECAQRTATSHRKNQHEIPPHRTRNATHRIVTHDHLPPRARRLISEASTTQQELGCLARHGHRSVG